MPENEGLDSPRIALREGIALVVGVAVVSPFLFAVVEILPSRENTRLDELPALAVSTALVGLALVGVARIGYALLAKRAQAREQLPLPTAPSHLFASHEQGERSSVETPRLGKHHTPR